MIIEKILKQLTPERVKREIEEVQKIKLPPELQKWVKEYEKVGERDGFIWKWAYEVGSIITFPDVHRKYRKDLIKIKFFLIMFIVLLDDVADRMKDKKLLEEILKIPFGGGRILSGQMNTRKRNYLNLTIAVWQVLEEKIKLLPYYKKFKEIIKFDIKQILNGMDYAYLINENPNLINEIESQIYLSHNTPATISYMIDLSCIPNFDMKNLKLVRKIAWYAQIMTRIANWISTWEREMKEDDFTGSLFLYASENNLFKTVRTKKEYKRNVYKIDKPMVERYFLKQWESLYKMIYRFGRENRSIKTKLILKTMEKLTILHLANRRLI